MRKRSLAGVLAVASLIAGVPQTGSAVPLPHQCFERDATILGTAGDDHIVGTDGPDVIVSLTGNDRIDGRGGDDAICSGLGDDVVLGGDGIDGIVVDAGADVAKGEGGTDLIVEFSEDSFVGADLEVRDTSVDRLEGGPGTDWISSEGGDDVLIGGPGTDMALHISSFSPVLIDLSQEMAVSTQGGRDELIGIEDAMGSIYSDIIVGDDGANTLYGVFGSDFLYGLEAADRFISSVDGDYIDGGEGQVTDMALLAYDTPVIADLNSGTVTAVEDTYTTPDHLRGIEGFTASTHDDVLIGDAFENILAGLGGDDEINGGPADDILFGDSTETIPFVWPYGRGKDSIDGGDGSDIADGGPLTDSCVNVEKQSDCEGARLPARSRSAVAPGGSGFFGGAKVPWWLRVIYDGRFAGPFLDS